MSKAVAVVGATGAVGQQMLSILTEREFPASTLKLFASPRSLGKEIQWNGTVHQCQILGPKAFDGVDIAFFDASDEISKQWVPEALRAGAWVVDNSATYRLDPETPLVVPEINGSLVPLSKRRLVAGPNCSTVQLVLALAPIHKLWKLRRVVVSTYQSVSGAGLLAVDELKAQTEAVLLSGKSIDPKIFPHSIGFECLPQIGKFGEDLATSEERKVIHETRKILNAPELGVSVTAVRVPTFQGHAESVNIECERDFDIQEVRAALEAQPGVVVVDDPLQNKYPLVRKAAGQDGVFVGRIRRDSSLQRALNLWVVSDNLRKGAALNAVQIGELIP